MSPVYWGCRLNPDPWNAGWSLHLATRLTDYSRLKMKYSSPLAPNSRNGTALSINLDDRKAFEARLEPNLKMLTDATSFWQKTASLLVP